MHFARFVDETLKLITAEELTLLSMCPRINTKNIDSENAILDASKAMMPTMFMKSDDTQTTKAEVSLSCSLSLYIDQIIFAYQNV